MKTTKWAAYMLFLVPTLMFGIVAVAFANAGEFSIAVLVGGLCIACALVALYAITSVPAPKKETLRRNEFDAAKTVQARKQSLRVISGGKQ